MTEIKIAVIYETVQKYLNVVCWALSYYFLLNYLDQAEFGLYSFILSIFGIFSGLASFGSRQYIQVCSAKGHVSNLVFTNAVTLECLGNIVLFLILLCFSISSDNEQLIIYFTILTFANLLKCVQIYEFYLAGKNKGQIYSKWNLKISFLQPILILLVIYFKLGLIFVLSTQLIVSVYYFWTVSRSKDVENKIQLSLIRRHHLSSLIKKVYPYAITIVSASIYTHSDQIMLKIMDSYEQVAIYSLSSKIFYFSLTFVMIISRNSYKKLLSISFLRKYSAISLMLSVFSILVAIFCIPYIFGDVYSGSVSALIILSFSILPYSYGSLTARWLEKNAQLRVQNIRIMLAAALNILLNLLLIPMYGSNGAAIATLASFSFQFLITPLLYPSFRSTFKGFMSSIVQPKLF